MNSEATGMKVGILVDSEIAEHYIYRICSLIQESSLFKDPIIIICDSGGEQAKSAHSIPRALKAKSLISSAITRTIQKAELKRVRRIYPNYGTLVPLSLLGLKTVKATKKYLQNQNQTWDLESHDIAKIQTESCDILLRLGDKNLSGKILKATRFGIISTCHSDSYCLRGDPEGFWEVCKQIFYSGFTIQQLTECPNQGRVLFRGRIQTQSRWLLNIAALREKSTPMLINILSRIASSQEVSMQPSESVSIFSSHKLELGESLRPLAKYLAATYIPRIIQLLNAKFSLTTTYSRWSVAVAKNSETIPPLCDFTEISHQWDRFLADPFMVHHNGRNIIFAEDMNCFEEDHGTIVALEIVGAQDCKLLGTALKEDFHLSFPYIFTANGDLYMLPECHKSKQIRLYKCSEFPLKWDLCCILMENVVAVDSLILARSGMYYLLTNICSAGIGDLDSELHIFYSRHLESADWRPLSQGNPVIFDASRARNGGLIRMGSDLYRINQHHENGYGTGFKVNKITHLSTEKYDEVPLLEAGPNFKPGINGTHHFFSNGDFHLVDYRRPVVQRTISFLRQNAGVRTS